MSGLTDIIFARATGSGLAAVSIIRMSGTGSGALVTPLVSGRLPRPRVASVRMLRAPVSGEALDEALVLWFPGPASYTGEDLVELHLHGGVATVAGVESALLAMGCRLAEPGEFTRRAFLNGRMDLTQAEAVADLIAAETDAQRRQALRQAGGDLARLYDGWTRRLTRLLAQQEAAIEFEMDGLPSDLVEQARLGAALLRDEIAVHLDDGARGERLRDGISIAIIGAPNAGKSSLLNTLAGRDAAIVSPQAGTTRDIVECRLALSGVPVTLADTAGLRDTADLVEQEGVRRAARRAESADIVLALFAADRVPDRETVAALARAEVALVIGAKADLAMPPRHIARREVLPISTMTGEGLDQLRLALERMVTSRAGLGDAPSLTRDRHRSALSTALACLDEATGASLPEVGAEGFRAALMALGRLTGRVEVEQVLDAVFRDFCIGK